MMYPAYLGLAGLGGLQSRLENLESIDEIEKDWQEGLNRFIEISRKFHLYERETV